VLSTSGRRRKLRRFLFAAVFALAFAVPSAAAAAPTVVTLTFDDGTADQYVVRSALAEHSLHATFFVNSNRIESGPSYLTWSQLSDLAADGNEIGGHTLDHVNLTSVSASEAQRQVCDDRQALVSHGFTVTSFAWPFGARDASLYSILQGCGYSSARRSWGLCALGQAPPNCGFDPVAETIPPQNIWEIRTVPSVRAWHTLADLQGIVSRAETGGGGWVPIVLHHVCDACDPDGYSISPAVFNAFLDWLRPRSSTGTYVRTMRDVASDTTAPASSISCNGSSCSSTAYTAPVDVSLSATDAGSGVDAIRYTLDGSDPTASSQLYTGPFAVSTTTTVKYRAWDAAGNVEATNSRLIEVNTGPTDTTPPVSSIACNGGACSAGWYGASVSVTLSATDTESGVDAIRYTIDGSDPTVSSQLYSGPFTVSTTTTVKYRAWDTEGNVEGTNSQGIQIDTVAPTVAITSPANGASVTGNIKVVASPADTNSGVASVVFYVDGSPLGTSTSAPWQIPWNTRKSTKGQHVLSAVATDRAGNTQTSASVTVTVR
jgi:peptidoglycan/xylan/chitin deacetylase (PgdA/CDA1 family)